jgi:hypothetical protein
LTRSSLGSPERKAIPTVCRLHSVAYSNKTLPADFERGVAPIVTYWTPAIFSEDGHGDSKPQWFLATLPALYRTSFQGSIFIDIQMHAQSPSRTVLHLPSTIQLGGGQLLWFRLFSPHWNTEDRRERAFVGDNNLFCCRSPGASFLAQRQPNTWKNQRKAQPLGGWLVPTVPTKWPGGVDLVVAMINVFKTGHLGRLWACTHGGAPTKVSPGDEVVDWLADSGGQTVVIRTLWSSHVRYSYLLTRPHSLIWS